MKLNRSLQLIEVAEILGCRYIGKSDHVITGLNEIHCVEPGDLTFVDVKKYYNKALGSAATTVLINQEVDPPEGKALILSDDPFRDYNRLAETLNPRIPLDVHDDPELGKNVKIGQHVSFGRGVVVGDDSEIGHNAVIGSHVLIGKGCLIHPNVTIYDHTIIGDDVCINAGTVIGGEAFYFKSRPERKDKMLSKGRVIIEDHVDIGANCTIDRGVSGDTVIGEWTKLDNLIQIGHDTRIGKRCIIASQVGIGGVTVVEDDVTLWGQVGITKDVVIGKGATLLAKTGVMSSLDGGKTYLGMIAAPHRQKLREISAARRLPEFLKGWK